MGYYYEFRGVMIHESWFMQNCNCCVSSSRLGRIIARRLLNVIHISDPVFAAVASIITQGDRAKRLPLFAVSGSWQLLFAMLSSLSPLFWYITLPSPTGRAMSSHLWRFFDPQYLFHATSISFYFSFFICFGDPLPLQMPVKWDDVASDKNCALNYYRPC